MNIHREGSQEWCVWGWQSTKSSGDPILTLGSLAILRVYHFSARPSTFGKQVENSWEIKFDRSDPKVTYDMLTIMTRTQLNSVV